MSQSPTPDAGSAPEAQPPRRTRAQQQQDTRRRLLDAAAEVFTEAGFEGASIDEISARAGFSRGAFYSNFTDKFDLLVTLCDRRIAAFADSELPEMLEVPEHEQVGVIARWLASEPLPIEVLLLVELARQRHLRPESSASVQRVVDTVLDAIAGLMVADGGALAHLSPQAARQRAQAVLAAVLGLDLLNHLGVPPDPQMIALLIRGIIDEEGRP